MAWQKCPICNGHGTIASAHYGAAMHSQMCPTCSGKRIINEISGLPPVQNVASTPVPQSAPNNVRCPICHVVGTHICQGGTGGTGRSGGVSGPL